MRKILAAIFGAFLFLTLAASVFAQAGVTQAQLNGTVYDPKGGAIVKATVGLRNVDTNQAYTTTSSDQGSYVFTNLPPGNYELRAQYTGFANYKQTGVILAVAQVATINITLKIEASETVTVNAQTPVIEPTRTEISQVIDTRQIQSLPINGRLFTDFALLTPGVSTGRTSLQSTFTDPTTTRISFGGQRDLNIWLLSTARMTSIRLPARNALPPHRKQ